MTTPRLFIDTPLIPGTPVPLAKDESHYLMSVLRRAAGDPVRVFNGRDGEWEAKITEATRKGALLELVEQVRPQAPVPDLWLLFAPVKRTQTNLIIEKATELGVREIHPVSTRRTQNDRIKLDRFHLIAKEAAEQTERLDLPVIQDITRLDKALESWDPSRTLIYCDEAGDEADRPWGGEAGRGRPMLDALTADAATKAAILIGPEGGFAPEERAALRDLPFVCPVTLGPRILRAETAVMAALTLWQAGSGDWR
jgi:16S rRNA (uracil1498-N3)-methyltransferase